MEAQKPPREERARNIAQTRGVFDPELSRQAARDAVRKLDPREMVRNPVMFVVEVGTAVVGFLAAYYLAVDPARFAYNAAIFALLLLTVLFANFAEGLAEARGRAQADSLRKTRADTPARRLVDGREEQASSTDLVKGDRFVVEAGEIIAADGEIVEGIASVDESAITGESAPVIREAGSDFSSVTGGTRVLSDHIVVEVTSDPGQSFLDTMISLVEGASRQKTPNEIALTILLAALDRHLPHRHGDAAALLRLHRRAGRASDPHSVAGLPDTDDHRCPALGHRYRRDGPRRAGERPRQERPGRRGSRRRGYPAPRQDRHRYPGQPAGHRIRPPRGRLRGGTAPCRVPLVPGRRDPRGTLHRRARRGAGRRAREPRRGPVRALHAPRPG